MTSNTASLAQSKSSSPLEKHPTSSDPIRRYLRKLQLCLLLVSIGVEVGIDVPYRGSIHYALLGLVRNQSLFLM